MNCREAQHQIFAERDSARDDSPSAALGGHLAQCAACRRIQDDLTAALTTWRAEAAAVIVPDAEREWHAVRRKLRGGAEAPAERSTARSRRNLVTWFGLPLGAAAAAAVALFIIPETPSTVPDGAPVRAATQIARANSVEAPGNHASTMVFVDDKSGWLIVWASDGPQG